MAARSSLWIAEMKHIDEEYVHCLLGHGVADAEVRASDCWKVIHWWAFFKHSLLDTVTYRALPWPSRNFSALPESLCISYYEVLISDAGFGPSLYHFCICFSLCFLLMILQRKASYSNSPPHLSRLNSTQGNSAPKKKQSLPLLSKKKHHQSQHH